MTLEQRALVDVEVPIRDPDREVAERVGRDVDAAGNKTVALHRREGSIVPDDLGDRIRRRHVAFLRPSYEMDGWTDSRVGLTRSLAQPGVLTVTTELQELLGASALSETAILASEAAGSSFSLGPGRVSARCAEA